LIVLGVKTTKDPKFAADVVSEICEFDPALVDPDRTRDVAQSLIYPALPPIAVKWYESNRKPSRGVAVIEVPPGPASNIPYLLVKAMDDSGKIRGNLFGYFERKVAAVPAMPPEQVHLLLREGMFAHEIRTQYQSMIDLLGDIRSELESRGEQRSESDRSMSFTRQRSEAQKAFGGDGE
jgi:hypothetical protein